MYIMTNKSIKPKTKKQKPKPRQKQKQKQYVKQSVKVNVQSSGGLGGSGGSGGYSYPPQTQYIPQVFHDRSGENVQLQRLMDIVEKSMIKPHRVQDLPPPIPQPQGFIDTPFNPDEAIMSNPLLNPRPMTNNAPLLQKVDDAINESNFIKYEANPKMEFDEMDVEPTAFEKEDSSQKPISYYFDLQEKANKVKAKRDESRKQEAMTNIKDLYFDREALGENVSENKANLMSDLITTKANMDKATAHNDKRLMKEAYTNYKKVIADMKDKGQIADNKHNNSLLKSSFSNLKSAVNESKMDEAKVKGILSNIDKIIEAKRQAKAKAVAPPVEMIPQADEANPVVKPRADNRGGPRENTGPKTSSLGVKLNKAMEIRANNREVVKNILTQLKNDNLIPSITLNKISEDEMDLVLKVFRQQGLN